MKPVTSNHNGEKGQALLLVVVALSIFLLGAVGLAVDGGTMYVHRQMAQAAADAAAQAGIMSMFTGTNAKGPAVAARFSTKEAFSCTTTDLRTPCVYARLNKFGATAADTVTVDFPPTSEVRGVTFSSGQDVLIRVTVRRNIDATLMRMLGPAISTIRAVAIAAIVDVVVAVPILITHPTMASALSGNGGPIIRVCGGPSRSVQVNSRHPDSVQSTMSGVTIDLSRAGPLDSLTSPCTTGTGGNFGVFGGPAVPPFSFLPGTKPGKYLQPVSPIRDPFASVPEPSAPAAAPAPAALADGVNGCPSAPAKACKLYSPGLYATGIDVQNETGVFMPGLYYIGGAGGFKNGANGVMIMATGFAADAVTGAGMVVYNAGSGTFAVGSNSDANLVGSDASTIYKTILFFEKRTAPAKAHRFGGGGAVTLKGAIYITNSFEVMDSTPSQYQLLELGGNAGSTTRIIGQIIVGALLLSGNPVITMQLDAAKTLKIRQVALVK